MERGGEGDGFKNRRKKEERAPYTAKSKTDGPGSLETHRINGGSSLTSDVTVNRTSPSQQ